MEAAEEATKTSQTTVWTHQLHTTLPHVGRRDVLWPSGSHWCWNEKTPHIIYSYICNNNHKTGEAAFHQLLINMQPWWCGYFGLTWQLVDGTVLWPGVDQGGSRYSTLEDMDQTRASRTFRDSMALFRPSWAFLTSTWTSSMLHLFKRLTLSCSCWYACLSRWNE